MAQKAPQNSILPGKNPSTTGLCGNLRPGRQEYAQGPIGICDSLHPGKSAPHPGVDTTPQRPGALLGDVRLAHSPAASGAPARLLASGAPAPRAAAPRAARRAHKGALLTPCRLTSLGGLKGMACSLLHRGARATRRPASRSARARRSASPAVGATRRSRRPRRRGAGLPPPPALRAWRSCSLRQGLRKRPPGALASSARSRSASRRRGRPGRPLRACFAGPPSGALRGRLRRALRVPLLLRSAGTVGRPLCGRLSQRFLSPPRPPAGGRDYITPGRLRQGLRKRPPGALAPGSRV